MMEFLRRERQQLPEETKAELVAQQLVVLDQ
jgi:hypothetical protein